MSCKLKAKLEVVIDKVRFLFSLFLLNAEKITLSFWFDPTIQRGVGVGRGIGGQSILAILLPPFASLDF